MNTNDLKTAMDAVTLQGKQVTLTSTPPIEFVIPDNVQQLQQKNPGYVEGGTKGIGGVATRTHATSLQQDGSRLFSITGPAKATGLWFFSVPTAGWKTGLHILSCDYMYVGGLDGMHEFDLRNQDLSDYGANCSSAYVKHYPDVASDGALVVSGDKGQWLDSKIRLTTPFPAGVWVHRAVNAYIDFEKKMFGIQGIQVGPNIYPMSQNFKALVMNWTKGQAEIQMQIYASADTGNSPVSVAVNNLSLV